jgi:hypothetical protein
MPDDQSITIQVHGLIAKSFSNEYVEAVLTDALEILPSDDSLIVISPRRVAIVLDKLAHRGAVLPANLIEEAVTGAMKEELLAWLTSPATSYYVMHIAADHFADFSDEHKHGLSPRPE